MVENTENAPIVEISHERFLELINSLAEQIKKSGFKPKKIVAVPRGGLIVATYLSHRLGDISVLSDVPLSIFLKDLRFSFSKDNLVNDILIVDDIFDTGKTLKQTFHSEILDNCYKACLVQKPWSKIIASFIGMWSGYWIRLPWEVK
jgi:hypoxanthine phosphoribosyltransferase